MLIHLLELCTTELKEKTYDVELGLEGLQRPDGFYPLASSEPVHLRICHLGGRKLYLEGKARFSLDIPCGRCLEPVTCPFDLELIRELDLGQTDEERLEALDEQPYINGYSLDVDQLVRNELILNLPMKVLCDEDCRGICSRCGTNLNTGSCDCGTSPTDPRMAVIQDIFKQFKEV